MATRENVLERRSKQLERIRHTLDEAHAERAELSLIHISEPTRPY